MADDALSLTDALEQLERLRRAAAFNPSLIEDLSTWSQSEPRRRPSLPSATRLRDGTRGYYCPRPDCCWAAAVATTLQVPIDEVPDPEFDARIRRGEDPNDIARSAWQEFGRWLAGRSLDMYASDHVPLAADRWIGIVPRPGFAQNHCLVMTNEALLFDPAAAMGPLGALLFARHWGPEAVQFGYIFGATGCRPTGFPPPLRLA